MTDDGFITIIVVPVPQAPGRFSAKLAGTHELLATSSRAPFLDAARRLLELGHSADAVLVMKHAGSDIACLRAAVGKAAALTVKEKAGGSRPRFAPWVPYGPSPVSPPVTPKASTAGKPQSSPGERMCDATGARSPSPISLVCDSDPAEPS
jgi:hypothetical protein